jgi:hypothetical protein
MSTPNLQLSSYDMVDRVVRYAQTRIPSAGQPDEIERREMEFLYDVTFQYLDEKLTTWMHRMWDEYTSIIRGSLENADPQMVERATLLLAEALAKESRGG